MTTGWIETTVGEVFDIQLGKMLSRKAKTGTTPFPYLANRNVQWGTVDLSSLEAMDFSEAERAKLALRPGDLLVCEGGEVGRTAIWRGEVDNCYFQKAIHRLRPKCDTVLPGYMLRFMKYAADRGFFARLTSQTSIAHLTKEKLHAMRLLLPPVSEQRRIADILDKADAIRRKRQEALGLLDDLLPAAFLDMFGDPVGNPKGWQTARMSDAVLRIESGWSVGGHERSLLVGERAVLKISAVTSGRFRPSECKVVEDEVRRRDLPFPRRGDLLFSRANTRELVGATCLVESDFPELFLPDKLWRVTPRREQVRAEYLRYLLANERFRDQIRQRSTGSSGSMMNVSQKKLLALPIPLADLTLQDSFAELVWSTYRLRSNLEQATRISGALSDALVQQAFGSRLDANDVFEGLALQ